MRKRKKGKKKKESEAGARYGRVDRSRNRIDRGGGRAFNREKKRKKGKKRERESEKRKKKRGKKRKKERGGRGKKRRPQVENPIEPKCVQIFSLPLVRYPGAAPGIERL